MGDLGRQPRCCFGRHALAGKLQGAEDKEAEVLITKKLVLFGSCAAEIMVHVEPQGSPNRVVNERRPFLLVLYDKNCVCKTTWRKEKVMNYHSTFRNVAENNLPYLPVDSRT